MLPSRPLLSVFFRISLSRLPSSFSLSIPIPPSFHPPKTKDIAILYRTKVVRGRLSGRFARKGNAMISVLLSMKSNEKNSAAAK